MSSQLGIIYSEELLTWKEFVTNNLTKILQNKVKFVFSTDEEFIDKRKQLSQKMSNVDALIIMVSPKFILNIKKSSIDFLSFSQNINVYLFFCGVPKNCFEMFGLTNRFDKYEDIPKFAHDEIRSLLESVVNTIDKGFVIVPKYLISEDQSTKLMLTFDDELEPRDSVDVEIEGICDKQTVRAEQLSPNVYTFSVPEGISLSPGKGSYNVLVNNKQYGTQSLNVQSCVALNQVYVNILDTIFSLISKQTRRLSLQDLDKVIAKSLDTYPKGVSQLFHVSDQPEMYELPTIVHLASKYNLKEFYSALKKLDKSKVTEKIRNSEGITPIQMMPTKRCNSEDVSRKEPISTKSLLELPAFPEHQRELIGILNDVKVGEISVGDAEKLFQYWTMKHENKVVKNPIKISNLSSEVEISSPIRVTVTEDLTPNITISNHVNFSPTTNQSRKTIATASSNKEGSISPTPFSQSRSSPKRSTKHKTSIPASDTSTIKHTKALQASDDSTHPSKAVNQGSDPGKKQKEDTYLCMYGVTDSTYDLSLSSYLKSTQKQKKFVLKEPEVEAENKDQKSQTYVNFVNVETVNPRLTSANKQVPPKAAKRNLV